MALDRLTRSQVYPAFAELFAYPTAGFEDRRVQAVWQIMSLVPDADEALTIFAGAVADYDGNAMEEIHTRTFDIMARVDPYLSSQIFGQESYKRGQLMVGLVEAYKAAGLTWGSELPDHLAVVLKNIACFDDAAWRDMVEHCLREAVVKMRANLKGSANPYAHLFDALVQVLAWDIPDTTARMTPDFALDVLDAESAEEASRV